ncbi:HEPN domain-containing protein [Nesterenkonia sp. F]|uniref:ApeA N-terminal domain 1-containing protein n=1 Tax=Nesterenkonia sp. F TaxID=795955 RepID=UPI000255CB6F|nr:HEPN domain-containing protein [Nesterenkonia sp. F]
MKQQAEHLSGVWWRPAAPDRRWHGALTVDGSDGGRLVVLSRPFSSEETPAPPPDCRDETLVGVARSRPVTLLGCTMRGSSGTWTDRSDPPTREVVAREVLLGIGAGTPETLRVHSASAVIPELAVWMARQPSGPHGWGRDAAQLTVDDAAAGAEERTTQGPEPRIGPAGDGLAPHRRRIEIVTEPVVAVDVDGRPVTQVRATVTAVDGITLAEARMQLCAVQELASLMTQTPPTPLWVLADPVADGPAHHAGPVEWCWRQVAPGDGVADLDTRPASSQSERTPLADVLPAWQRMRQEHRTALDLLLDELHTPHRTPQMHLLALVAAAEAFFASSVDDSPRRRKDTTLRMKLRHLADRVIIADGTSNSPVADWAEQAARARNSLTHGDESHSPAQLAVLARATTEVLMLNVLTGLGVPSSGLPQNLAADARAVRAACQD